MSHDKVAGLQGCRVVVKIGVIAEGSAIYSIFETFWEGILRMTRLIDFNIYRRTKVTVTLQLCNLFKRQSYAK